MNKPGAMALYGPPLGQPPLGQRMGWWDNCVLRVAFNDAGLDESIERALAVYQAVLSPPSPPPNWDRKRCCASLGPFQKLTDNLFCNTLAMLDLQDLFWFSSCSTYTLWRAVRFIPGMMPALRANETHRCLLRFAQLHPLRTHKPPTAGKEAQDTELKEALDTELDDYWNRPRSNGANNQSQLNARATALESGYRIDPMHDDTIIGSDKEIDLLEQRTIIEEADAYH